MVKASSVGLFILTQIVGAGAVIRAQPPQVIEAAAPGYPRLPSGGRESGEVQVQLAIAASGEVARAQALSGPDRLRSAAEVAARKWRFGTQDKPTEKWIISFGFNLRPGLGDPPAVLVVYRAPNRIDVFAEQREVFTISDPPLEDVDKGRKGQKKR